MLMRMWFQIIPSPRLYLLQIWIITIVPQTVALLFVLAIVAMYIR